MLWSTDSFLSRWTVAAFYDLQRSWLIITSAAEMRAHRKQQVCVMASDKTVWPGNAHSHFTDLLRTFTKFHHMIYFVILSWLGQNLSEDPKKVLGRNLRPRSKGVFIHSRPRSIGCYWSLSQRLYYPWRTAIFIWNDFWQHGRDNDTLENWSGWKIKRETTEDKLWYISAIYLGLFPSKTWYHMQRNNRVSIGLSMQICNAMAKAQRPKSRIDEWFAQNSNDVPYWFFATKLWHSDVFILLLQKNPQVELITNGFDEDSLIIILFINNRAPCPFVWWPY